MKQVKSYFETKDKCILRLNDIKYINYPCRFIEMNGGRTVIFSKDESDDFDKCIQAFKEMRDIFDEYDTLKVSKEIEAIKSFEEKEISVKEMMKEHMQMLKRKETENETDK